ncbi:ATP-dependent RNA helicase HelY [Motilibacter rhizosphaerae]|uniref:Probable helicase HelY n=1 Tax=Motilibacter rhizosphaerae TaxID=598652 RepID=A0A4Q7NAW1_9ACTN|nr:DEAD/DEAH box helicase [Motilibacter rhizosphaerae]RZS80088.1 ATP-dependent RNA helicase HelY [Motilibacter rhizosphaerae]
MTSAAERYAAARRRAAEARTELGRFSQDYPFGLDEFQLEACRALEAGRGVLVAAPTGAGKTVVGEFAVHLALAEGHKCFYTTPIKALSNQKFHDLVERYGPERVGLLTGDNVVNGEAPIVVMTTEVLRNMLYSGSATLAGLAYVVMDEVHYLADRFRGAVWEEVIIHLPESVRLVSLSATVSNAEEFGDWLVTVRGDTAVVLEEHRPVPLWQHILVGGRLHDMFTDADQRTVNPEVARLAREQSQRMLDYSRRGPKGRPNVRGGFRPPSRVEVIEGLRAEGLLPAITFIFSRAGCDAAVQQCLAAGLRLNTPSEALEVRGIVDARTAQIPDEDLHVLGFDDFAEALERGVAAHHAGLLPTFKEIVEELFVRGLVKAVFATETLALGINMPARSVVLEKLSKWNGETHADVTPGEYTQLTGRAGRRGIDVEGHAVVLFTPGMDPQAVVGLASTRTYPLRSSFRPSYNMAVNLVRQYGRTRSRELLETSFAQFQADRSVVGIARQVQRGQEALEGYREAMRCELGDFSEYAALRRALSDREAELSRQSAANRRAQAAQSLERLKPGDVIEVPSGRRAGLAVVLDPGLAGSFDGPRPTVLTADRQVRKLTVHDFPVPVKALDTVRIPRGFNPRNPQMRRDLASSLRNTGAEGGKPKRARSGAADDPEIARLRQAVRDHPCHRCPDREDHARWAERAIRLERETAALERRVAARTGTISRTFDRVTALLEQLGYLEGDRVTPAGERLSRLYTELDLLAAECLREGVWEQLDPAELAACASALVYEARQSDDAATPRLPPGRTAEALDRTLRLWGEVAGLESEHRLEFTSRPDLGFAWPVHRWAGGARLDVVLRESGLAAGDFVRWCKQVMDLLGQLADAAPEGSRVRGTALQAIARVKRGVVAYSSVS